MGAIVRVFSVAVMVVMTLVFAGDSFAARCYLLWCDQGYYAENEICRPCPVVKTCCRDKGDPDCVVEEVQMMTPDQGLYKLSDCKLPPGTYQNDVGCFEVTEDMTCNPRGK